jgi:hypothetical protein
MSLCDAGDFVLALNDLADKNISTKEKVIIACLVALPFVTARGTRVADFFDGRGNLLKGKLDNAVADAAKHLDNAPSSGATFFGRVITPHIDDLSTRTIRSFTDGKVTASVLQHDTVFYRVWGEEAGRVGSYMTRVKPTSRAQAMESLALDPAWNNSRVWISEVHVPAGVPIYEGTAAAEGILKGGGNQVFIPSDWLVDFWFRLPKALR